MGGGGRFVSSANTQGDLCIYCNLLLVHMRYLVGGLRFVSSANTQDDLCIYCNLLLVHMRYKVPFLCSNTTIPHPLFPVVCWPYGTVDRRKCRNLPASDLELT